MYHVRLANSNNKWIYDFRFDSYLNNTIEKNHKRKVKFGFSRRHETTGRDVRLFTNRFTVLENREANAGHTQVGF